ncbi:MAG: hypothetical protein AB1407_04555 [Spirochaetota bacterium]
MTLQIRRRSYWILFGVSCASTLLALASSVILAFRGDLPVFLIEHGIYSIHEFLGLRIPSQVLSLADAVLLCGFAVTGQSFILRSFRQTVSAEIFFFAFWLCCASFEALRPLHLLLALGGSADGVLAVIDKAYTGVKFFGYSSLFISGLYASGMRNEKHLSIVAVCAAISVALATSLPVNTGIWDRTLLFKVGYSNLINGFAFSIIIITITNYIIATRVRGDRSFYYVALGLAASTAGTFLLSKDISPLASLAALVALGLGSWLYINKLHSYYLWQ